MTLNNEVEVNPGCALARTIICGYLENSKEIAGDDGEDHRYRNDLNSVEPRVPSCRNVKGPEIGAP